jgi:hypothetical protein
MVLEPFGQKLLEELFDFDCWRVTLHFVHKAKDPAAWRALFVISVFL